jgi:hypothetical protein
MKLPAEFDFHVNRLATALAEHRIRVAHTANQVMFTEFLRILMHKEVLSAAEVERELAIVEAYAIEMSDADPDLGAAVLQIISNMRRWLSDRKDRAAKSTSN